MADKNNTSSLLEAIKNKLSKFDNKPKPEKKSSVNYFSQDLQSKAIDEVMADKTNIGIIFEAEKKLEAIDKKNLNLERNREKDSDLDLDDESLEVKNLGQKISIESKIKEIADELNLEEFEDDFEDDKNAKIHENHLEENSHNNLESIDIELMELEKEISKNNQKSENEITEDLNLKNYLDSKFEDEFKEIENKINNNQNISTSQDIIFETTSDKPTLPEENVMDKIDFLNPNLTNSNQLNPFEESLDKPTLPQEKVIKKIDLLNPNFINSNQLNPFFSKEQFSFKATPAQDFLASIQNKSSEEVVEKTPNIAEDSLENIIENAVEPSANLSENFEKNEAFTQPVEDLNKITPAQDFLASMQYKPSEESVLETPKTVENFAKKPAENYLNSSEKVLENSSNFSENIVIGETFKMPAEDLNKITPAQDFLASMQYKPSEESVLETPNVVKNFAEKPAENYLNSSEKVLENSSNFSENIVIGETLKMPVEDLNKITQQNNFQFLKPEIINQEIPMEKNAKLNEFNNSKDSTSSIENVDQNNMILEKINYNLIREETVYQASNSMKKLMEAKNLVNNIGNFARDETLTKIAVNLMEPKLEKWLNDNLPLLVENIVREEIEKIVPKS